MSSYAASEGQILRKLRVPNALPYWFTALRIATTLSVIGAVVGEFFGGPLTRSGSTSRSRPGTAATRRVGRDHPRLRHGDRLLYLALWLERVLYPVAGGRAIADRGPRGRQTEMRPSASTGPQATEPGGRPCEEAMTMGLRHREAGRLAMSRRCWSRPQLIGGGGASPTVSLTPIKFQLQWVAQSQFAGYYAALDQGYYKDAGLDVSLLLGGPNVNNVQVVATGGADIGTAWLPNMLQSREGGTDLAIAQVFQRSGTPDRLQGART